MMYVCSSLILKPAYSLDFFLFLNFFLRLSFYKTFFEFDKAKKGKCKRVQCF